MSLWTEPFLRMWSSAYDFVPGIIFAIIILAVGYLIGGLLGWIVEKILSKIEIKKFCNWCRKRTPHKESKK